MFKVFSFISSAEGKIKHNKALKLGKRSVSVKLYSNASSSKLFTSSFSLPKRASLTVSAAVSILAVYPGVYYYFSSTSSRLTME